MRSIVLILLCAFATTAGAASWANVIAILGNPLDDVSRLGDAAFVMKAGQIYKTSP